MTLSTPGLVLHTTPYAESSVVARVFTRQLGVRSYIIKGVRGVRGRVKQSLLQPLTSLDMVVYANPKSDLNYVKELSPRHVAGAPDAVANALRFFMTEVLYKTLREEEPMPELWDYVEEESVSAGPQAAHVPVRFMLTVARYLGIEPLDNHDVRHRWFDLQEGRFVGAPGETTLPLEHSALLHAYLCTPPGQPLTPHSSQLRGGLLSALIAYFQLHLSGIGNIYSHEILHTILR